MTTRNCRRCNGWGLIFGETCEVCDGNGVEVFDPVQDAKPTTDEPKATADHEAKQRVQIPRPGPFPNCDAYGVPLRPCPECYGLGVVPRLVGEGVGLEAEDCEACCGTGEME